MKRRPGRPKLGASGAPISVLFTDGQRLWLERQAPALGGISAAARAAVQYAIEMEAAGVTTTPAGEAEPVDVLGMPSTGSLGS